MGLDVAFHAQRAMQELSFDTFKSVKAQEITLPASLQMKLPQDYVNYTKISWVDSAGIKHLLYPTGKTSNPYSVRQDSLGNYTFPAGEPALTNPDFSSPLADPWFYSDVAGSDTLGVVSGELTFTHFLFPGFGLSNTSRIYSVWQEIDVSEQSELELSAKGTTQASDTDITGGTLKIGVSTTQPDTGVVNYPSAPNYPNSNTNPPWAQTIAGNDAVLGWTPGESAVTKTLEETSVIDVSPYNTVWLLITSFVDMTSATASGTNSIDDISLLTTSVQSILQTSTPGSSTTWSNYKSATPSENQDDYQDDTYWPMDGSRFGLDPQHAQANGSFYIDNISGKIHFSSNISGKTVVLDYISDSLGTDGEMQVHKFAEEAMYRWILHAIAAGRIQTQQIVPRLQKEKFAAIRQAKLRLSNIKIEELTQILRGKSKQIKH